MMNRRRSASFLASLLALAIPRGHAGGASGSRVSARHEASGPPARSSSSFLTGIGDQQTEMFTNPLWQHLHTKIARYIAPYDAAVRPYSLSLARAWIQAAEEHHQQILLSFYHSEYTPLNMPSVATYQKDVQKFVKLFPRVKDYQPWDEANRGTIPHELVSPSPLQAAQYYQALKRVCSGCQIVGLDVLDQRDDRPTLTYIAEFKKDIGKLRTVMPHIWGLHNYSDTNRFESYRTSEIVAALPGEVWLTETGGIVHLGSSFPNNHGSGLTRAAKALSYMFKIAASQPRITRLYIFQWSGATGAARFDAGLTNPDYQPREGYVVVCKALHGSDCNVKTSKN